MKKIFLVLSFVILISLLYSEKIILSFDKETNSNIFSFQDIKITESYVNSSNTIFTFFFDKNIIEEKTIFLDKGPLKKAFLIENKVIFTSYFPIKNFKTYENKIIFESEIVFQNEKLIFNNIKLEDLIKIIFNEIGWQYFFLNQIPDISMNINSKDLYKETILRILEEFYKIQAHFYDEKTIFIGNSNSENHYSTPIKIDFEDKADTADNILKEKEFYVIPSFFDLSKLENLFECSFIEISDKIYVSKLFEEEFLKLQQILKILDTHFLESISENSIMQEFHEEELIEEKIFFILESEEDLNFLKNYFNYIFFELNDNKFLFYSTEKEKQDILNISNLINKKNENVEEFNGIIVEEEQFFVYNSDRNLYDLKNIFDLAITKIDNYYIFKGFESELNLLIELLNLIDKDIESSIDKKTDLVDEVLDENIHHSEKILKSFFDLKFLENIYEVKINHIYEDYYILKTDEDTFEKIITLLPLVEKKIQKDVDLVEEKISFIQDYIIISSKQENIFTTLLTQENIDFKIILKNEDYYFYMLNYNENQKRLVNSFLEYSENISNLQLSLEECIKIISELYDKNIVYNFTSSKKININYNKFDLDMLLYILVSNGINYHFFDEKTIYLYESEKLLKFEFYVFALKKVDNFNVDFMNLISLYLSEKIVEFSSYKNETSTAYLISNPIIHAKENETANLSSLLSIPIFKDDELISKIESGFSLEVTGFYDRITETVHTNINLKISEIKDYGSKSVDERTVKTNFYTNNNDFIKVSSMTFENTTEILSGVPILKSIPLIGKIFQKKEYNYSIYEMVILLKTTVLNSPENEY